MGQELSLSSLLLYCCANVAARQQAVCRPWLGSLCHKHFKLWLLKRVFLQPIFMTSALLEKGLGGNLELCPALLRAALSSGT